MIGHSVPAIWPHLPFAGLLGGFDDVSDQERRANHDKRSSLLRMGGFFYDEMTVRWPDIDFETKFDMETYENETKTPIDFKSSCRQRRRDLVQLAPFTFYAGLRSTDLDEGSLKDLKANNRPSPKWPAVKTRPQLGLLFCDEITEDTIQCSSLVFRAAEILEQGAALVVICPPFLVRNIIKAAQESGK